MCCVQFCGSWMQQCSADVNFMFVWQTFHSIVTVFKNGNCISMWQPLFVCSKLRDGFFWSWRGEYVQIRAISFLRLTKVLQLANCCWRDISICNLCLLKVSCEVQVVFKILMKFLPWNTSSCKSTRAAVIKPAVPVHDYGGGIASDFH